jgi:hypothetical protein
MSDQIEYVMLKIYNNCDSDMSGTYFIQYTGNENDIDKFLTINGLNNVKFISKKYRYEQIIVLKEFTCLFDTDYSDNVEILMLSGKFNVKGQYRVYDKEELEQWWETFLESTKCPEWSNFSEKVINLNN